MEIVVIVSITWVAIVTLALIYISYKFFIQINNEFKAIDDEINKFSGGHNMVITKYTRTKKGCSCVCDLLPNLIVDYNGDFEDFKKCVQKSIDFYIMGRRLNEEPYAPIFDENYKLVFVEVTEE